MGPDSPSRRPAQPPVTDTSGQLSAGFLPLFVCSHLNYYSFYLFLLCLNVYFFILREKVSDQAGEVQREGRRKNPSKIHALTAEPDGG